jgi:Zn-dependent protease
MLWQSFYFNLFLFFFNLMPIPPLDGSHILYDLFPNQITARLVNLGMYGALLLMLFIYSPLWGLFSKMLNFVVELFVKVAGL